MIYENCMQYMAYTPIILAQWIYGGDILKTFSTSLMTVTLRTQPTWEGIRCPSSVLPIFANPIKGTFWAQTGKQFHRLAPVLLIHRSLNEHAMLTLVRDVRVQILIWFQTLLPITKPHFQTFNELKSFFFRCLYFRLFPPHICSHTPV